MSIDIEQKKKALDAALLQIEKQYGKGAVMKLGDPSVQMNIETIPTGSLSLDIALGLGGIPKGRIIEIYGPESSGKTTVTLHMIAEVQKRGGIAGFIDAEHALDPVYAKNIGVDIDNLYISISLRSSLKPGFSSSPDILALMTGICSMPAFLRARRMKPT